VRKLGIREGMTVLAVDAPAPWGALAPDLPHGGRARACAADMIVPASIVAPIEFFAGPAEAPLELGTVSPCGTVLIWTKHGR